MKNIIIIGGDKRMLYAAEKLSERFDCRLCGFGAFPGELSDGSTDVPGGGFDAAILPLPSSRDLINVNCPFGRTPISTETAVSSVRRGGLVLAGKIYPRLTDACERAGVELIDYFCREELAVMNAQLTAEGAVAAVINELEFSVRGSRALVCGFGRIGSITARYLSELGAHVSVSARKFSDLARIKALGFTPVDLRDCAAFTGAVGNADLIINTVPAPVFDRKKLSAAKAGTALFELSSVSCIADMSFAAESGIRLVTLPGLPGKTAPRTAGEIIADTVVNILTERSIPDERA